MIAFYFCVIIFLVLVAYAGLDETMRLFAYLDLQLRFAWVRTRMFFMRKTLERQLSQYRKESYEAFIKETEQNDQPSD